MVHPSASYAARAVAVLALGCLSASAGAAVTLSNFPPNPGVLPGGGWQFTEGTTFGNPTGPRAWVNGVYGGVPKAVATDTMVLAGRAGGLGVSVASAMTMGSALGAVARCVALVNPVCAVGTAAYIAYKAYRATPTSGHDGQQVCGTAGGQYVPCSFPSAQFDVDPGQAPTTTSQPDYFIGGVPFGLSATHGMTQQSVCTAFGGKFTSGSDATKHWGGGTGTVNGGYCTVTRTVTSDYINGNPCTTNCVTTQTVAGPEIQYLGMTDVTQCPAVFDALDPAYSIPSGSPLGPDGKCPTARYNHRPMTPQQLADQIAASPGTTPWTSWQPAVGDAIDRGGQTAPSDITTSGPASQTGQPEVVNTTNPDGSTKTETKTPTYNYTYAGDTITYNTTYNTTTQTCTAQGSCSTTVVNTTTAAPKPQDPNDPCTANPSRVGCMSLGDLPTDQVPKTTKDVAFTPETVGVAGSCPSPVVIPGSGGKSISYQTVCDGVTQARPLIIAIGFLMAGGIMLGALKVGL